MSPHMLWLTCFSFLPEMKGISSSLRGLHLQTKVQMGKFKRLHHCISSYEINDKSIHAKTFALCNALEIVKRGSTFYNGKLVSPCCHGDNLIPSFPYTESHQSLDTTTLVFPTSHSTQRQLARGQLWSVSGQCIHRLLLIFHVPQFIHTTSIVKPNYS